MKRFDPNFLIAALHVAAFKRHKLLAAQAGLIDLALRGEDFTAADLPAELTGGSKNIPGLATGTLLAQGLIACVGRVRSPNENANGRKLDLLRLAPGMRSTAITWLLRNELPAPVAGQQMELA